MQQIILYFILATLVLAQTGEPYAIKTGDGRFSYFVAGEQRDPDVPNSRPYYLSGHESTVCNLTGFLKIRLSEETDPDRFAQEHGLRLEQKITGSAFLFRNTTEMDDMQKASGLWDAPGVISAEPQCQSKRRLQ